MRNQKQNSTYIQKTKTNGKSNKKRKFEIRKKKEKNNDRWQ